MANERLKGEFIYDGWKDDGFKTPLDAARSNPDLLPDSATFWPKDVPNENRPVMMAAAQRALARLDREETWYISMKVGGYTVRSMARIRRIHFSTAWYHLQNAIERLRTLTKEELEREQR